jgi:hypothetical protein
MVGGRILARIYLSIQGKSLSLCYLAYLKPVPVLLCLPQACPSVTLFTITCPCVTLFTRSLTWSGLVSKSTLLGNGPANGTVPLSHQTMAVSLSYQTMAQCHCHTRQWHSVTATPDNGTVSLSHQTMAQCHCHIRQWHSVAVRSIREPYYRYVK